MDRCHALQDQKWKRSEFIGQLTNDASSQSLSYSVYALCEKRSFKAMPQPLCGSVPYALEENAIILSSILSLGLFVVV